MTVNLLVRETSSFKELVLLLLNLNAINFLYLLDFQLIERITLLHSLCTNASKMIEVITLTLVHIRGKCNNDKIMNRIH